jgi:hypothetical protein
MMSGQALEYHEARGNRASIAPYTVASWCLPFHSISQFL